ncbi:hypothetical protein [Cognatiyoonia sp. IB215182]|uniref:hypothetical protein n=1 Tax=Cognatiyoonia sp. IB215182 TaxID=3097353 RepID=UPI002A102832|nr:hypothetical protein [Cognatiyoonia sp. IB215182]MDX8352604.1 hypothetical protein [Cognatiyoonia sp. IB215182]
MADTILVIAGCGGILIALVHAWLGHTLVLKPIAGLTPTQRSVNAAVFQLSTLYWIGAGLALLSAPWLWGPEGRQIVVLGAVFIYASAAIANAWATSGRHFGWIGLGLVSVMALAGL